MPTEAHLTVQYNTNAATGTATKDPDYPNNNPVNAQGDVSVDPGADNTITFTRVAGDPPRWKFVGIDFEPQSTDLSISQLTDGKIVVADDNGNNGPANLSFKYTLTLEDVVTRRRGTIDPKIINKTANVHTK